MSASDRSFPGSIDDLLSSSRDRFDELFDYQMSGGRAAKRRETAPDSAKSASAPSESGKQSADNSVAELNRLFGLDWSSNTVREHVENGRVTVEVELKASSQQVVEAGSSRVADGEDEAVAIQRAVDRALKAGARRLTEPAAHTELTRPEPQERPFARNGTVDAISANRLEVALTNIRGGIVEEYSRNTDSAPIAALGIEATAIMDGRGRMISGSSGSFLAHMLDTTKIHLGPGDVLLQSDPYGSAGASGSAKEWVLVCPAFQGSDLVGYVSMRAHLDDVGGAAEGSSPTNASSVFEEGVRVPAVKIYETGVLNVPVLELILTNSRTPDINRAALLAMVAACQAGATAIAGLRSRFGAEAYHRNCAAMLERTRSGIRDLILQSIPEEPQSFEDVVDDDGLGNGPFPLRLTVWREGEHAYFDWTGTAAQAQGPVNFYLHVGLAKATIGKCLTRRLGRELTGNDGFYDLLHVLLPQGSLLHPEFPAATGRNAVTFSRHLEVLTAAVSRHDPDTLDAAGVGPAPTFSFIGQGFHLVDEIPQGGGARSDSDGAERLSGPNGASTENLERDFPVVIERHVTLPGTGGAGLHRGGNGVEKVYRVLAAGKVSLHDDRHASCPWGVNGGKAGTRSTKWIVRSSGGREALPAKLEGLDVQLGDRIVFRTAGGGGFGKPMARDPKDVRRDVAMGLLSIDAAAGDYGVVINAQSLNVDLGATEQLRSALQRENQHSKLFDRGDSA